MTICNYIIKPAVVLVVEGVVAAAAPLKLQPNGAIEIYYYYYWLRSFSKSGKSRSRSIWTCETRLIQSGEKEHADLSGRSGRGHLVLVCTECRRPCPLLLVNTLRRCPAAQMGVGSLSQIYLDASEQIRFD